MALQHYVNHISLVVDKSSSMAGNSYKVVEVFDRELNLLKQRSVELNQETRISIYLFADTVELLTFDMDVMRFTSLKGYYNSYGNTALLDAVGKSIEDNRKLPEIFGDHAFLQYVITDGEENRSRTYSSGKLSSLMNSLPDNWTTAVLVPNSTGERYALQFGFNAGSISIWDTSKANALDTVGTQFTRTIDNYMTMRASGIRGTTGLFTLDTSNIKKSALQEISNYSIYPVTTESAIKEYVEFVTKRSYRLGSVYHQPVKTIKIQDYKNILVQDVKTSKVYEGNNLRQLLGLPNDTADVNPGSHKDWRIFVQSTSVNRKLYPNSFILVRS